MKALLDIKNYYLYAILTFLLGFLYCIAVYRSGTANGFNIGTDLLIGIPNYYFFYVVVLPFVCLGVVYIAIKNKNIRLFGPIEDAGNTEISVRLLSLRRILPPIAILFAILVTFQDAIKKDHILPPNAYSISDQHYVNSVYACLKGWKLDQSREFCDTNLSAEDAAIFYQQVLSAHGYSGSLTEFDNWLADTSLLYKYENFLSFLGALIIALFIMQVIFLIVVKDVAVDGTKDIVLWLGLQTSFWFPTKYFSIHHYDFHDQVQSGVLVFAVILLLLAGMTILFIKTKKNDLSKYGVAVGAVISGALSYVGYYQKDSIYQVLDVFRGSFVYPLIVGFVLVVILYLVTEYFIKNYEKQVGIR